MEVNSMLLKNWLKRAAPVAGMRLLVLCAAVFLLLAASAARAAADACRGQAVVTVNGMACPFCAYGLRKELLTLPGVKDVQVDLNKSQATVAVRDGSEVKDAEIRQAVKEAGFTPGSIRCQAAQKVSQAPAFFRSAGFNVAGMQCEHCAANITAALEKQKGVRSAAVDLAAKHATITYDSRQVTPAALAQAIEHAGKFQATLTDAPVKRGSAD